MHLTAALKVSIAQRSEAGQKSSNEDSMGASCPDDPVLLTHKGVAAVIADGVSTADAGREAAEICVKSFLDDYYSTPETWTVESSCRKVLTTINNWLYQKGAQYEVAHKGYVSTFTCLVLKSRTAYVLHAGDTRVNLWRDGELKQLTRDHTVSVGGSEKYLARAMGFDTKVEVDLRQTELEVGDVFVLTSDGVHDYVDRNQIAHRLTASSDLDAICDGLIDDALAANSPDNVTCQVLRVEALPDASADEYVRQLTQLPFPPELSVGSELDGFVVERELHASSRSQLYLVRDPRTDRRLVMKTPSVNYEDDPAYIERFLLEHWIGGRVRSKHLLRSIEPPARRSCLYSLREYVEGCTLAEWIASEHKKRGALRDVDRVVEIVGQCVRGLIALHRREILHQDLKPGNIVLGSDGHVTIIDYGSCSVAGIEEITAPIVRDKILGTASYAAPEYVVGIKPDPRAELYSLGCITYEMLTGKQPYGEAVERPRTLAEFRALVYTPSYEHNPHVPVWMDRAIQKAVQVDVEHRYQELTEFIYDLENPNPDYLKATSEAPGGEQTRNPWKIAALVLIVSQAITLYLYLSR
jgi:serine/threonine protein phosphatase PrpC